MTHSHLELFQQRLQIVLFRLFSKLLDVPAMLCSRTVDQVVACIRCAPPRHFARFFNQQTDCRGVSKEVRVYSISITRSTPLHSTPLHSSNQPSSRTVRTDESSTRTSLDTKWLIPIAHSISAVALTTTSKRLHESHRSRLFELFFVPRISIYILMTDDTVILRS
jgi:hypothetical protein